MKKTGLDTFMDYRMLSSLTFSPDGKKLAYVLTGIDREKKEYVSRLRLRDGDSDRLMVSDGRIGEFFFEDPEHILFSTDRRDRKKEEKDAEEKGLLAIMRYDEMSGKMREWVRRTILQEYEEAEDHPEYRHFLKSNFSGVLKD